VEFSSLIDKWNLKIKEIPESLRDKTAQAIDYILEGATIDQASLIDEVLELAKRHETLTIPEERWTKNRRRGEKPHEFILRAWGDPLPDWLDKPLLRKTDSNCLIALERQERHSDPEKRPPSDFHIPTKKEMLDRRLKELERTGGEGMSFEEQERLRRVKNKREQRAID